VVNDVAGTEQFLRHAGVREGGQRRLNLGLIELGAREHDDDSECRVGSLQQAAAAGVRGEGQVNNDRRVI